jgi:8-oxo-dGTP pyrophosphatase MutT (NUDIX family)
MNREKLPYRKTCEIYLTLGKNILAQDRGEYIEFPGGGIDKNETPEQAAIRETLEETGAVIESLKELKIINFKWDENWAKTEKQKARYNQFKGEEMHFFTGKIKEFVNNLHDDSWKGEKLILLKKVIELIKSQPFSSEIKDYRTFQLDYLISLIKK